MTFSFDPQEPDGSPRICVGIHRPLFNDFHKDAVNNPGAYPFGVSIYPDRARQSWLQGDGDRPLYRSEREEHKMTTYIYRYSFNEYGGHVEVAIFDPNRWPDGQGVGGTGGGARFGFEAEVFICENYRVAGRPLHAEVSIGGIGGHSPDDALLRIAVYGRAAEIARRANNIIAATVGDSFNVNATTLCLPPQGVEVDGNGSPISSEGGRHNDSKD